MSPLSLKNPSATDKINSPAIHPIFLAPYSSWKADQLLHYFKQRDSVHYFPVIDQEETSTDKMHRLLHHEFVFHHEAHHLASPLNWLTNPSADREWLFMLHKFYYGVGLGKLYAETHDTRYANTWMELTESWIDQVPLDFLPGRVAGRRIQNWIYSHAFLVHPTSSFSPDPDFYLKFLDSLFHQVNYLIEHLDQARNHRTLELCAIFLAGVVFPEFRDAVRWVEFSVEALHHNIQEDLLADGVHCELSTEYHHLVLKNYLGVLSLAKANQIPLPEIMLSQVQKALEFSLYVHKPDGFIPALSDADTGSYRDLLQQGYELFGNQAFLYAASQGKQGLPPAARSQGFAKSGYYIMRSGWGDHQAAYQDERYLIIDCGPLGRGNHGHLDALNVEIAGYGRSLIVDPGRYTYDESGEHNWRAHFRGTAAHNTVMVDGKNQTAYQPGPTRYEIVGSEPLTDMIVFESQPAFDYLHAVTRSAEYPVVHERKILFLRPDYWIIADLLIAQDPHQYDLLFHLSPEAHNRITTTLHQDTLTIQSPNLLVAQPHHPGQILSLGEDWVAPTYGTKSVAPVIKSSQHATIACFHTVVFPFAAVPPDLSIQVLPVSHQEILCSPTTVFGMCVSYQTSTGRHQDSIAFRHLGRGSSYRIQDWDFTQHIHIIRTKGESTAIVQHSI